MKPRVVIPATIIFLASMVLAADITSMALRNRHLIDLPTSKKEATSDVVTIEDRCGDDKKLANLSGAKYSGLQRLAEYQDVCKSGTISSLMIFADMPKDDAESKQKAKDMAVLLQEFADRKVRPIVIIEPVTSWGFVDFAEFRDGFYDSWIKQFFAELKHQGISDSEMGVWVPFPEANLPYWNHQSVKPEDFGLVVNRYVKLMKKEFPKAHASILLNSASYDNSDFDWTNEEYISLLPYVKKIDKTLINSFGMQGFPWSPRAGSSALNQFDASRFLNADLAIEAAEYLGIKNIWLNTATFMSKYTLDEESRVDIDPATRQSILMSIKDEAKKIQARGYTVSINLFAENKSNASEETNWSYWSRGQQLASPHTLVFHSFASALEGEDIDLWLFDR
jgi:hypothetical protein